MGVWDGPRGTNLLDSGAPFYDVYECADGEYVALGSIEPQFYAELVRLSGLAHEAHQMDRSAWPEMREELTRVMKAKAALKSAKTKVREMASRSPGRSPQRGSFSRASMAPIRTREVTPHLRR